MSDLIETWQPLVDTIAAEYGRKFYKHGAERADVSQELWYWIFKHPRKLATWAEEEDGGTRLLARTLRNEASRYCQTIKAQDLGYKPEDLAFYNRGELKVLLDAVFDEEAWLKPPVDEGGGRSKGDPAMGGNWLATLADVANAYQQLEPADKDLLALYHREGYSNILLAEMNGVTQAAQSNRHTAAINRLHRLLGGDRPGRTHDDPCECEYVGTRRSMTNAAARAVTDNQYAED